MKHLYIIITILLTSLALSSCKGTHGRSGYTYGENVAHEGEEDTATDESTYTDLQQEIEEKDARIAELEEKIQRLQEELDNLRASAEEVSSHLRNGDYEDALNQSDEVESEAEDAESEAESDY